MKTANCFVIIGPHGGVVGMGKDIKSAQNNFYQIDRDFNIDPLPWSHYLECGFRCQQARIVFDDIYDVVEGRNEQGS